MKNHYHNLVIVILTVLAFILPVWLVIAFKGMNGTSDFLAGDIYYYLVIARNVNDLGLFTFDQEHLCNSFHFLWQIWCIVLYRLCISLSLPISWPPLMLLFSSTVLISIAIIIFAMCIIREHSRLPALFILLPYGLFAFFTIRTQPNYGTLWSYSDGMESCLVLLFYAIILYLILSPSFMETIYSALTLSSLVTLLFLARIDHIFFAIALFSLFIFKYLCEKRWACLLYTIISTSICIVVVVMYMCINKYYFDVIMPVSGIVKSSFPHPKIDRLNNIWENIAYTEDISLLWRYYQIFIPPIFGVIFILYSFTCAVLHIKYTKFDFSILITSVFVLLLGMYNYLFVGIYDMGHWYFPISVIFVSISFLHISSKMFPLKEQSRRWFTVQIIVLLFIITYLFNIAYGKEEVLLRHRTGAYNLYSEESDSIKEHYKDKKPKIIEYDDGEIAYATGFPAIPATLLTADIHLVEDICEQHIPFLKVMLARGYDRVAIWQPELREKMKNASSEEIIEKMQEYDFPMAWHIDELGTPCPIELNIEYMSSSQKLAVFHITYKNEDIEKVAINPPEMLLIPTGIFQDSVSNTKYIEEYEIGKYEITNEQYLEMLNWAYKCGELTDVNGNVYTDGLVYMNGYPIIDTASNEVWQQIIFNGEVFKSSVREGAGGQHFSMLNHPVTYVSYYGAVTYCNWLSKIHNLKPCYDQSDWTLFTPRKNGYRLPTESEWERSASWDGMKSWLYGNGSDIIDSAMVNHNCNNPLGLTTFPYTSSVGWFNGINTIAINGNYKVTCNVVSPVGAYDMAGNVFEWCYDWYSKSNGSTEMIITPKGTECGYKKVVKGGSWFVDETLCRVSTRIALSPTFRDANLGFRLARTPIFE